MKSCHTLNVELLKHQNPLNTWNIHLSNVQDLIRTYNLKPSTDEALTCGGWSHLIQHLLSQSFQTSISHIQGNVLTRLERLEGAATMAVCSLHCWWKWSTVQRNTWFLWDWSTFLCSWEAKTCSGRRESRAVSSLLNQWEILHFEEDCHPARATFRQPLTWSLAHSAWHRSQMLQSRRTGLHTVISICNTNTERHTILQTFNTRMQSVQEFFWNKILNPFSFGSYSLSIVISIHYPDSSM